MKTLGLILIILVTLSAFGLGRGQKPLDEDREKRVNSIIASLEADNTLRYFLARGDRGTGSHYAWMDQMKKFGIKQVSFTIRFWRGPSGWKLKIVKTIYLAHYYRYDKQVVAASVLKGIRNSGLARALADNIVDRSRKTVVDLTNENSGRKICGTLYVNLLDDEVLPILDEPTTLNSVCPKM